MSDNTVAQSFVGTTYYVPTTVLSRASSISRSHIPRRWLEVLRMSRSFNPANPQFRRGVLLFSIAASSVVGTNILLTDFGSQEHVFSPLHRAINPRIDALFGVSEDDLKRPPDLAASNSKTAATRISSAQPTSNLMSR